MIPLMPSPGSPKTVSTPQSASRSISASDAIRAIIPSASHWTVPFCPSRKRSNVAPGAKRAQDNREPGKLALPGPQLGRLRGGYRLLVLVLRLLRRLGGLAKLNPCDFLERFSPGGLRRLGRHAVVHRESLPGDAVPRVPGPNPVNRRYSVRLDQHRVREQLPESLSQQGRPVWR